MMALLYITLLLVVPILTDGAQGQELSGFLAKHRARIENFVMAGYGGGWDHCDIVTDYYHEADFLETVPQLIMGLEKSHLAEKSESPGNFLFRSHFFVHSFLGL